MIKLLSPADGELFSVTTDIYKEFARREYAGEHRVKEEPYAKIEEYFDKDTDGSRPAFVRLKWHNTSPDAENRVSLRLAGELCVPAAVGKVGSLMYSSEEDAYYVDVMNLMSGETYIWSVDGSEERTFSTACGDMRNVSIPHLANVRDIGGRVNADGVRVKQGLIYRGVSLNNFGDISTDKIRAEVARDVKAQLGIKCDLDLRDEAVGKLTQSPLGPDVRFELIPFGAYGATLNDNGRAVLRQVLEVMEHEENYPIYFHCHAGADRTGTVGAYLDAILGMKDEDIILNYNVTTLAYFDSRCWHMSDCGNFAEYLEETYPELSLCERLMANLRLSGISEKTINKIREIMLAE